MRAIKSHYKQQLKWQAASILGSVDFLGNHLGFASDLTEGVYGLIFGLGRVVLDEQDTATRQRILDVPSGSNSTGDHLMAGFKVLIFGLLGSGVTSIINHTYIGAQNDGFQGFISGLGKGIVGTVTKPHLLFWIWHRKRTMQFEKQAKVQIKFYRNVNDFLDA